MPQPKLMKAGSADNFQTDPVALDCLAPYLKKEWLIWESAMGNGNLLVGLHKKGFNSHGSDIIDGFDFLKTTPDNFDCIVTNPPYSIKEQFLARCYELGKPFALLMPITTFDSIARRMMFQQYGLQVIFPRRRINFETPNHEENVQAGKKTSAWFYTAWFCHGLDTAGRELVFDEY